MLKIKKLSHNYLISTFLTLMLVATLVAVPCGAKTSWGQLDLNQLMNTNSCNGLAGHATLFRCPVFTDLTDNDQTNVQNNQSISSDVQYMAPNTQTAVCNQNNIPSSNTETDVDQCNIQNNETIKVTQSNTSTHGDGIITLEQLKIEQAKGDPYINPDFVKYLEDKEKGINDIYVPPPVDPCAINAGKRLPGV